MKVGVEDLENSHGLRCLLATHESSQMQWCWETQRMESWVSRSHKGKIWRTQVAQQVEPAT